MFKEIAHFNFTSFCGTDLNMLGIPLKAKENIVTNKWPQIWPEIRRKFGEVSEGSSEKSSEKGSEKSSEKIQRILELIFANNRISAALIAEKVGLTSRAVEKQLSKLKAMGIIERVGSAKAGHWKILIELN